jgi:hypothetical protein
MAYSGEFIPESFKLVRGPAFNKKHARHVGVAKEDIPIIQRAFGRIKRGKSLIYVKSSEIVASHFDPLTGYLTMNTRNGKSYKVKYKIGPEELKQEQFHDQ